MTDEKPKTVARYLVPPLQAVVFPDGIARDLDLEDPTEIALGSDVAELERERDDLLRKVDEQRSIIRGKTFDEKDAEIDCLKRERDELRETVKAIRKECDDEVDLLVAEREKNAELRSRLGCARTFNDLDGEAISNLVDKCERLERERDELQRELAIRRPQPFGEEWQGDPSSPERKPFEVAANAHEELVQMALRLERERDEAQRMAIEMADGVERVRVENAELREAVNTLGKDIEELMDANEECQRLEAKLARYTARTADGVTVGPGDEVYVVNDYTGVQPMWVKHSHDEIIAGYCTKVSATYSTREAAEAASKEQK